MGDASDRETSDERSSAQPRAARHRGDLESLETVAQRVVTRWRQAGPGRMTLSARETAAAEATPTCPQCHGAGFVRSDVEFGHPEFGRAFACECQRANIRERRQRRYSAYSDLPLRRAQTFATFDVEGAPRLAEIRAAAEHYAAAPEGWLVLAGTPGVGKSHLAAAIAHEVTALGGRTFFLLVDRLLDHLRATYAPESEVSVDELASLVVEADLLVLDDLQRISVRPWARAQLFKLLDQRYTHEAPTIFTTNLTSAALTGLLRRQGRGGQSSDGSGSTYDALLDDRLCSRLLDRRLVTWIAIEAPDYRRTQGARTNGRNG